MKYPKNKLLYFVVFTVTNALLAYGPFDLQAKLWIGLIGLVLPFVVAFQTSAKAPAGETPLFEQESFSASISLWLVLTGLAIVFRMCQTHVPDYWPVWDDGRFAYYAVELSRKWSWHFLYAPTQHPPVFFWALGLFFKVFSPSLFTLWLFPALCSILNFALFTWAARMVGSKSFSLLFGFLMALSFWPLYTGRFCMYMVVFLVWEALTFVLFLWLVQEKDRKTGKIKALLLGLSLGAGFWVAIAWPVVAGVVLVAVGWHFKDSWRKNIMSIGAVILPTLALGGLFFWVSSFERNGVHVGTLWAFGPGMDPLRQFLDSFSNLSVLFWGCDLQNSYGPVWGGVLNPILGGFFGVGILECYRQRARAWVQWLLFALILLLLPGILTRNFDLFRNVQALPLVLGIAALGTQAVLLSYKKWIGVFLTVLIISAGLDLRHLWLSYHPGGLSAGSNGISGGARAKAYELLRRKNQQAGPGMVLFDLKPHEADQTLGIATYSFNAAVNPNIPLGDVKWVALLVNANYQSFLAERFPHGSWSRLFSWEGTGDPPDNPELLGVVPVEELGPGTLERWARADQALREVVWLAADLPEDQGRGEVFQQLNGIQPLMEGDALLESFYWETVFKFNAWENAFGDKDYATHTKACYQALNQALQKGYPTAFFYNEMGIYFGHQKDWADARACFLNAVYCNVDLTLAPKALAALEGKN